MDATTRIFLGIFLTASMLPSSFAANGAASVDPTAGTASVACAGVPDGTACDDGNSCTAGDRCQSRACIVPAAFTHPPGSPIGVAGYPKPVAADVNHDGIPDLVVLNYSHYTMTILLGDGTGGFTQPPGSPVPTPGASQCLTVADFDLDGDLDVAIASASPGAVSVYSGDGAGGFTPSAQPPILAGQQPRAIAAGDFNLDGKPDVVTAEQNVGTIRVLLGNGSGGFTEAPGSPFPGGSGPGLVVDDFNRDGKPDVAVADPNSEAVRILLGDGSGGLTQAPGSPLFPVNAFALAPGDLNLDGKPDLVVAAQVYVTVLSGDGAGGFTPSVVLAAPVIGDAQGYFSGASVGDFNVDGKPDVAVLNYWTEEITILLGDGSGGFVEFHDPSFGVVSAPISAPTADFNLDGKVDLAVANADSNSITIFLNSVSVPPDGTTCSDGNACTTDDACGGGVCYPGAPATCDPPDQCHAEATCDPGSGVCTYSNEPDGTTCDDGDPQTSGESCENGVCTVASCSATPKPKSAGYYKKLCHDGHGRPRGGDALTDADAVCVGSLTVTFAGLATVDEICDVIDTGHHRGPSGDGPGGKECDKGEDELMALALNLCRHRVCSDQAVDSKCSGGPHDHTLTTVGASLAAADAILADPARDRDTCKDARCLAKEVNNGRGLRHTSLLLAREVGNEVRLNWESPAMDDGSGEASSYTVWRRPLNSGAAFVRLGVTSALTYVDHTAGSNAWEYEVTFTIEP